MTCTHEHYADVAPGVRECIDCGARVTVGVDPASGRDQSVLRYVHIQSGEIVEIVEDPTE